MRLYKGIVTHIEPEGAYVEVPVRAPGFEWGPLEYASANGHHGLAQDDEVVVGVLGTSMDSLVILGVLDKAHRSVGAMESAVLTQNSIQGSFQYPVFIAPYDLRVTKCSLTQFAGSVTGSSGDDSNMFVVALTRYRNNVSALIAQKTTGASATSEPWDQRADWNFDDITFDTNNSVCQKGDIVAVNFTVVGTPNHMVAHVLATVGYTPI